MSGPAKAELGVLDRSGKVTETIPVQFNPTTMRVQMSNSTDGGASRGRQKQQYNGSASTTLTVDLEFDTADEGSNGRPVDVRTRTDKVRQFVLPGGAGTKQAPPRVRFRWGTFELSGVMDSLTEELGFFSTDGVPLRSKLSVQIKEQDARFAALVTGAGANTNTNPPAAGERPAGAGPGSSGGGPVDRAAVALAGETAADFLARNGLAPDAWRALGSALDVLGASVELEAGVAIGFSAELSIGGGLGVSAGFQAGLNVSVGASLGLSASAGGSGLTVSGLQQGFALAAAGGLTAASHQATTAASTAAAHAARASFGSNISGTAPAMSSAPPVPRAEADKRAASYGLGVPLRDVVSAPTTGTSSSAVVGRPSPIAPAARGARSAPWEQLSPSSAAAADREQRRRRPDCGCHRCDPLRATRR